MLNINEPILFTTRKFYLLKHCNLSMDIKEEEEEEGVMRA